MELIVAALILGPAVLIALLHRTRLWWLAGGGLWAGAIYLVTLVEHVDPDESLAGLDGVANAILIGGAIVIALHGLAALVFASRLHQRHRERVEKLPPAATVVTGVTRR